MDLLSDNLDRIINTHIQELPVHSGVGNIPPLEAVSLQYLTYSKAVPQRANTERIRTVGRHINALAIGSGSGERTQGAAAASPHLTLSSKFVIIPVRTSYNPGILFVDDVLPVEKLNSPLLYSHLSEWWGHYTVMAMCLRKFDQAKKIKDKSSMKEVRAYLLAERRLIGSDEAYKARKINDLIEMINRELGK
jgi:hypothetical protein